jgi:uncharacterized protein YcbK (DUF882 family)
MRGIALMVIAALGLLGGPADAGPKKSSNKGTTRQCSGSGAKKKCRRIATFSGANAPRSTLRTEPLERPTGELWLRAENLDQEVKVNIYKQDGSFDDASLAKLDDLFRCTRTGEVRAVNAQLYEQLSRLYDHFAARIDMVSGFRFAERDSSRHFHASAADFRIKGVSIYTIKKFAETLDMGNMGLGIYPTGQFIHLDFRAPGEPSFRWTDWSGHSKAKKKSGKPTGRTQPARKPTS